MQFNAMPCNATPRHAMPCHAIQSNLVSNEYIYIYIYIYIYMLSLLVYGWKCYVVQRTKGPVKSIYGQLDSKNAEMANHSLPEKLSIYQE